MILVHPSYPPLDTSSPEAASTRAFQVGGGMIEIWPHTWLPASPEELDFVIIIVLRQGLPV